MAAVIAASAVPMVCALPYSTQNVNHIRNHRAFGDLNIPSKKLEIIACAIIIKTLGFPRTILHGKRNYFGAHSNNSFKILFENRTAHVKYRHFLGSSTT